VRDREEVGWEDRDWAKLGEPDGDSSFAQSSYARRRSRMTRAFAIGMLLMFALIALASLIHL
jgi:hypothetical protein